LIDRLTDSSEGIEAPLPTVALVEELPYSFLDQFIRASIAATGKLALDLRFQVRR
jgi:hypothetical protein